MNIIDEEIRNHQALLMVIFKERGFDVVSYYNRPVIMVSKFDKQVFDYEILRVLEENELNDLVELDFNPGGSWVITILD